MHPCSHIEDFAVPSDRKIAATSWRQPSKPAMPAMPGMPVRKSRRKRPKRSRKKKKKNLPVTILLEKNWITVPVSVPEEAKEAEAAKMTERRKESL